MDTLTAIMTRRSIRNYLDEELDVKFIQEIGLKYLNQKDINFITKGKINQIFFYS